MIKLSNILHPTDFSESSVHAQKYACAMAEHFGASLHLLHVIADPTTVVPGPMGGYLPADYFHEIKEHAENKLTEYPDKTWAQDKTIIRSITEGHAFVEILRYAKEQNMDMIIMGTHGHSGLTHMLMGSVAEKVVRKASCPVLTVHPEDHDFVMP